MYFFVVQEVDSAGVSYTSVLLGVEVSTIYLNYYIQTYLLSPVFGYVTYSDKKQPKSPKLPKNVSINGKTVKIKALVTVYIGSAWNILHVITGMICFYSLYMQALVITHASYFKCKLRQTQDYTRGTPEATDAADHSYGAGKCAFSSYNF